MIQKYMFSADGRCFLWANGEEDGTLYWLDPLGLFSYLIIANYDFSGKATQDQIPNFNKKIFKSLKIFFRVIWVVKHILNILFPPIYFFQT